jgi:hypothetical protein
MEEGLLFYRVWMNRTRIPVDQAVIFPIPVFPHSANAPLSLSYAATVRAQFTLDFSALEWSEIGGELRFNEPLLGRLCA